MPERAKSGRPEGGGRPPRLDATNLAGLTTLMNPQALRPEADLARAEQAVMRTEPRGGRRASAEDDPVQAYTRELHSLAEELGIDFVDGGGPQTAGAQHPPPSRAKDLRPGVGGLLADLDLGSSAPASAAGRQSGRGRRKRRPPTPSSSSEASGSTEETEETSTSSGSGSSAATSSSGSTEESSASSSSGSAASTADDSVLSRLGHELGIDLEGARRRGKRRDRVRRAPSGGGSSRSGRRHRGRGSPPAAGEDGARRRHLSEVLEDLRGESRTSGGDQAQRSRDQLASKLEQIGQLRMTLEEEGVECGGVGNPTLASPPEEIDSVLNILKLKNDRNRYSTLAEEVILGFAEGIETVLDGSREIPVLNWKPDYSGYHNTVLVKLHRMRFETSSVVGSVIEKHRVGSSARIFMELLPSFFLYPRQQRKQKSAPGLHADPAAGGRVPSGPQVGDARAAFSAIRESDVPNNLLQTVEAI